MFETTTIVTASYYDSVVLMRVASQLKKRDGVAEVAMFMGTEGNHELLDQVGLATAESKHAGPQDLIIIVRADTQDLAEQTSTEATTMLSAKRETDQSELSYRPRMLDRALGFLPDASLAAISIPGGYAARETENCLAHDLNVFLFSDNVSLDDEARLKKIALDKGLLLMGPDCGTAYLNGVGLGFTNAVGRGRIGCVAAAGTGLQAVVCRIAQHGEGISHGIGVGGRDLSGDVGGLMTSYALSLLDQDPATEVIILISKPPHPEVARSLEQTCRQLATPVITCFQGTTLDSDAFIQSATLDEAADRAVCLLGNTPFVTRNFTDSARIKQLLDHQQATAAGKRIIGLFTGGTLAKEAYLLLRPLVGTVSADLDQAGSHCLVDLGDDRYTVGKPHPMIAPENRTEVLLDLAAAGRLDDCGALLFDLVLGHGSHTDPATELAAGLAELRSRHGLTIPAIVSLIGTEDDPQSLVEQQRVLNEAGATVFLINSEAARYAALLVAPDCRQALMEVSP
ncbi:MAG: acyl-CoA synthetase FdrA [Desulfofustis sp.]|jgi:FdrA protein|nr:acyl-CoA synthetase FdrA [Desulfofustis sp.]